MIEYKKIEWWNKLSQEEKDILISALYDNDLLEFGIYQNEKGEYVKD